MINEFDISTLIKFLLKKGRLYMLNLSIALVLGIVVVFSIPKTFTSEVRMVLETHKESSLGGGMGALSSLAGINLNKSQDAISPELYPDVVSTNKFLIDMLYVSVTTVKGKRYATFIEYAEKEERTPWWSMALKTTLKSIKSLWGGKEEKPFTKRINPNQLTIQEEGLVKVMNGILKCSIDKETSVITLAATVQDPLVAKTIADKARLLLQTFIIDYRTNKARTDLAYYQKLEKQLLTKYKASQKAYAKFSDQHFGITLKSYTMQETDLENEMQIAFNAYSQMKQQVSIAEGKVQENTPVFTIVEDSYVANKATSPKKLFMLASFLLISFFGTTCWIYFKLLFSRKP